MNWPFATPLYPLGGEQRYNFPMNEASTTQLRIGELAGQVGLNPKTIRYYEEIGLLPAPQRTRTGYRLYTPADAERLRFIGKGKALGLTLRDISEILAMRDSGQQPCAHVLEAMDRKLAAVEEQLRVLTELRDEILALREEAATTAQDNAPICRIIEHHAVSH